MRDSHDGARLWSKGGTTDEIFMSFTVGKDYLLDQELVPFDIRASLAHFDGLESAGFLSKAENDQLHHACGTILQDWARGEFTISPDQEDSHTAIEARLTKLVGDLGKKIHLGRSRNDQVVSMIRLAMLSWLDEFRELLHQTIAAMCDLAELGLDGPLAGYTHLQPAMPSSGAAWILGYAEMLAELRSSAEPLMQSLSRSALGSASGYGVPIRLDRKRSAESMGFDTIQAVTAVQLSRGLDELRFTQWAQGVALLLSRFAADATLYLTREFSLLEISAELTSGSSIMPNKKNPDLFELMRARGARFSAHSAAIASVYAGLPGGYQRDLQLVKESLMAAQHDLRDMLIAATRSVSGLRFNRQGCEASMVDELYATAYACELAQSGMPFREAYRKAAAEPDQWRTRDCAEEADAADNPAYCRRLIAALRARI